MTTHCPCCGKSTERSQLCIGCKVETIAWFATMLIIILSPILAYLKLIP